MKKSLVLAMAMALGVTASAYAANPFSDVPAGHWAYDSVNKLAAAGVVDGYPDGTYGGDKLMTRYEMAQIVAKAMAKGANVDKLAAEFADELDSLGVRVANLEEKADNVKITGEIRYHYADHDSNFSDGWANELRSRIWVTGQVNDDWSYTGMLENIQSFANDAGDEDTDFQRAYVNGKLGGMQVQAGRYNLQLGDKNVYDQRFDGVQVSYGKDVKLTAGYGKATASSGSHLMGNHTKDTVIGTVPNPDEGTQGETPNLDVTTTETINDFSDEVYYVDLSGKMGKLGLGAGYYSFGWDEALVGTTASDTDIWAVKAEYAFDKNVKLGAIYLMGEDEFGTAKDLDDDGYVVTASYKGAKASQVGSWGLVAKYYDQGATTYVDHTMNGRADKFTVADDGFKGYSVAANYTFAKNIVGQVEWYDLEAKEGNREAETIWSQLVFTF